MIDIEAMLAAIRANIEARVREGYGYGSLAVTVTVYPLNSPSQKWQFDARDFEVLKRGYV